MELQRGRAIGRGIGLDDELFLRDDGLAAITNLAIAWPAPDTGDAVDRQPTISELAQDEETARVEHHGGDLSVTTREERQIHPSLSAQRAPTREAEVQATALWAQSPRCVGQKCTPYNPVLGRPFRTQGPPLAARCTAQRVTGINLPGTEDESEVDGRSALADVAGRWPRPFGSRRETHPAEPGCAASRNLLGDCLKRGARTGEAVGFTLPRSVASQKPWGGRASAVAFSPLEISMGHGTRLRTRGPHAHRLSPRALRFRPRRPEPGAEAALAAIVKELREHPNMTIDLDGTTDEVGRLDYNLRLSQRRVEAVTRWLTSNGVDQSRVVGAKRRGLHAPKDDVKQRLMVKFMTSAE